MERREDVRELREKRWCCVPKYKTWYQEEEVSTEQEQKPQDLQTALST